MDEARPVIITYAATLGAFKILTSILILYYFPSWHAVVVIVALSIPWIVAGVWLGGIYSRIRVRLLRARMRRKSLLHQEWNVD